MWQTHVLKVEEKLTAPWDVFERDVSEVLKVSFSSRWQSASLYEVAKLYFF